MNIAVDLCAKCKGDSSVKDSRPAAEYIRRRRECLKCGERWTTYEVRHLVGWANTRAILQSVEIIQSHLQAIKESAKNDPNPDA